MASYNSKPFVDHLTELVDAMMQRIYACSSDSSTSSLVFKASLWRLLIESKLTPRDIDAEQCAELVRICGLQYDVPLGLERQRLDGKGWTVMHIKQHMHRLLRTRLQQVGNVMRTREPLLVQEPRKHTPAPLSGGRRSAPGTAGAAASYRTSGAPPSTGNPTDSADKLAFEAELAEIMEGVDVGIDGAEGLEGLDEHEGYNVEEAIEMSLDDGTMVA